MGSERSAKDRVGTMGIIGAGHIGQALARTALRAGREVVIANSRGPESLAPVVAALGAGVTAGTVREAAAAGIVAIAVPWSSVPAAVSGLPWDGQTIIDPTNAFNPADLGGRTSSEIVADLVPGARLVKAANTLAAKVLAADPHEAGGRRRGCAGTVSPSSTRRTRSTPILAAAPRARSSPTSSRAPAW